LKTAAVDIAESTGLSRQDHVAVEQPLEIRVAAHGGAPQPLAITMRTPGEDGELCAGFLFTEGLVHRRQDIATLAQTADDAVLVGLGVGITIEPHRHFAVTSACGVCGKESLDSLRATPAGPLPTARPLVSAKVLLDLPAVLRHAQAAFAATGGLHAAGLFEPTGTPSTRSSARSTCARPCPPATPFCWSADARASSWYRRR
jgi:FdhD protein